MSAAGVLMPEIAATRAEGNSLRVLLASWAPFHAGAEVAAERLAMGLREQGHKVTVVLGTEGETAERMRAVGLDVRHVALTLTGKLNWLKFQAAQRKLSRLFRELQLDVVHANDLPTAQMVGQAARRQGIPFVCHHRWVFGGAAVDWLNKFGAARHLFVSQALMASLCEDSAKLQASARGVVYDGLPLKALPTAAERRDARGRLGIGEDRLVVLFAGQIIERKGVEDLLRAWKMLPAEWSRRADLYFIGEDLESHGAYRTRMEQLAAELGCSAKFMGFQRNVSEWLAAADVSVVPSHVEPLGNATLEAMAHGLPVIGCRVGGIPEMILDGATGVLVPPHSPAELQAAIRRLLEDAEERRRLGLAARRRCEEMFSLAAHTDAIVGHYRSVLREGAAARG